MASQQLDVERRIDVEAEARPVGELVHGHALLLEPARQPVVGLDVREGGEEAGVAEGDDIGGVPVVRQSAPLARGGDRDQRPQVRVGRQGDRPGAEHDQAGAAGHVPGKPAEALPERSTVGRAALDANVGRTRVVEAALQLPRRDLACSCDQARQLARAGVGLRVQDSNGGSGHGVTLAAHRR